MSNLMDGSQTNLLAQLLQSPMVQNASETELHNDLDEGYDISLEMLGVTDLF